MTKISGREVFQATEATADDDGRLWITIIKEGVSQNNRNYQRKALIDAVDKRVYENARMFVDHTDGPPLKRSIRELVSGIGEVVLDTSFPDGLARVRGEVKWFNKDFEEFAGKAKEHIGVSHDAMLRGSRSMRNGRRYEDIDGITKAHSVDWVIYPSAGGGFEQFVAKEGVEMTDAIDWDAIDEDMLKEHKPELYKALTANRATESEDDPDDEDEDDEENGQESVKLSRRAVESLIESSLDKALTKVQQKAEAKAEAFRATEALVESSTLPKLTKARVVKSFRGAESFDKKAVEKAIEEAKAEVAAIAGPRVRAMGPSGAAAGSTKSVVTGRAHESIASVFGFDPLSIDVEEAGKDKEKN